MSIWDFLHPGLPDDRQDLGLRGTDGRDLGHLHADPLGHVHGVGPDGIDYGFTTLDSAGVFHHHANMGFATGSSQVDLLYAFDEQRRDGGGARGYQLAAWGERHEKCGSNGSSAGVTAA